MLLLLVIIIRLCRLQSYLNPPDRDRRHRRDSPHIKYPHNNDMVLKACEKYIVQLGYDREFKGDMHSDADWKNIHILESSTKKTEGDKALFAIYNVLLATDVATTRTSGRAQLAAVAWSNDVAKVRNSAIILGFLYDATYHAVYQATLKATVSGRDMKLDKIVTNLPYLR